MTKKRFHPITIIANAAKYLLLLLIPLIRALIFTPMGLIAWLRGTWIDVLTLLLIITFGVIRYLISGYSINTKGIKVKNGLFLQQQVFMPYKNITILLVEVPFFYRFIGASNVYIDTDAGHKKKSDIKCTIKTSQIPLLENFVNTTVPTKGGVKISYQAKTWEVFILSLIYSNTFTGIIFTATFISFAGKVIDRDINAMMLDNATKLTEALAISVPPIAAIITYILLGGWVISFLINLLRNLNFIVSRQKKKLLISSGVLTKRRYLINSSRINNVLLSQSVLTRLFRMYSGFITCNGYGKQKNEHPVFIPSGSKKNMGAEISLIFPEVSPAENQLKPLKPFLFRFIILPINIILGIALVVFLLSKIFKRFSDTIWFVGIMALTIAVWFLVVKTIAFWHTGMGKNGDYYTFRYTKAFKIYTAFVPREKIVKVEFSQTILQKANDGCDLKIYCYAESKEPISVTNMTKKEAKALFEV